MGAFAWSPDEFAGGGGTGNVTGPGSATDNAIARFDGTTGKLIQNSSVIIDDSGNVTAGVDGGSGQHTFYGATFLVDGGTTPNNPTIAEVSAQGSGNGAAYLRLSFDRSSGTGSGSQIQFRYGPDGSERLIGQLRFSNTDVSESATGGVAELVTSDTSGNLGVVLSADETYEVEIPSGDLNVRRSEAGGYVNFRVENEHSGSSSDASMSIITNGSGTPEFYFTQGSTGSWVQGLLGDGDFAIHNGSVSAANRVLRIDDTTNAFTIGESGNDVIHSINGRRIIQTASSSALMAYQIEASSSGEAGLYCTHSGTGSSRLQLEAASDNTYVRFGQSTSGQRWVIGLDDSDGDSFKLANSTALGTNDVIRVDASTNALTLGESGGTETHDINGIYKASIGQALSFNDNTSFTGTISALNPDTAQVRKFSNAGAKTLNGISSQSDARIFYYINSGGNTTITNESGSASADDRIITGSGANVTLTGDGVATFIYDTASSRWRLVSVVN